MTIGYNYNYAVPSTNYDYTTAGATSFQGAYTPTMATPVYDTIDFSTKEKKDGGLGLGTVAVLGLGAAALVKGKKSGAKGILNIFKSGFKGLGDDAVKLFNKAKNAITSKFGGKAATKVDDAAKIAQETVLTPKATQDATEILVEKYGKDVVANMSDVAYFHKLGDIC